MPIKVKIKSKVRDTRAAQKKRQLESHGFKGIDNILLIDSYTIDKTLETNQIEKVVSMLTNPVTHEAIFYEDTQNTPQRYKLLKEFLQIKPSFTWAIETGYLPGVTDNIAHTTQELIEDSLGVTFDLSEHVFTSQILYITGTLTKKEIERIANTLVNPLIQRVHIKHYDDYKSEGGMGIILPKVTLSQKPAVSSINLDISDKQLTQLGRTGILGSDGNYRGPLALDLLYMKAIQKYFHKQKRQPTDVELEAIAQTWSEHCKHTIFADPIDELKQGLFKSYIKAATEKIRKKNSAKDICVSVFADNSGAIEFDNTYAVTHKVETHNSPSALDPFGGAVTGIGGVNRDAVGYGLGAKPIVNTYGFCFGSPTDKQALFKDTALTHQMLSPERIMAGVVQGVNTGGNCSGIPTPQGFLFFDDRFRGKPSVFVGTVGLIPKVINKKKSAEKKALPGDYIVMVGGRVGLDGVHGATFSSEALHAGSPVGAVQIGDPITQKKLSDAIVKEARDLGLYRSITDNGAGGLSCSIAEMAKESGGCKVDLEKVPLKYSGLDPWQIWISESQERMTLAIPKKKWKQFAELMTRRGVEATVIGTFTKSGKCVVNYNGENVADLKMDFLHSGLPHRHLKTTYKQAIHKEPLIKEKNNLTQSLYTMLQRFNIAGYQYISMQYDHEVQGGSILKPLQGKGRVNADTSVVRPVLSSQKGIVLSQGFYPTYSDIDPYYMAACSIDTAIRNTIAAGANLDHLALIDNFCGCDSTNPKRLGELKRAVKACYDYALAYNAPFISGKDSMFNEFHGYDKHGKAVTISFPVALLISIIGVIPDVNKVVSIDAKIPGDLIYILGETYDELGGSEYFAAHNAIGNSVSKVNAKKNIKLYAAFSKCVQKELVASAISVSRGGLGVALAKTAMAGRLGLTVSLADIPGKISRNDFTLYSESQGRIIATINPLHKKLFEQLLKGLSFKQIGIITKEDSFIMTDVHNKKIINTDVTTLLTHYNLPFKNH